MTHRAAFTIENYLDHSVNSGQLEKPRSRSFLQPSNHICQFPRFVSLLKEEAKHLIQISTWYRYIKLHQQLSDAKCFQVGNIKCKTGPFVIKIIAIPYICKAYYSVENRFIYSTIFDHRFNPVKELYLVSNHFIERGLFLPPESLEMAFQLVITP